MKHAIDWANTHEPELARSMVGHSVRMLRLRDELAQMRARAGNFANLKEHKISRLINEIEAAEDDARDALNKIVEAERAYRKQKDAQALKQVDPQAQPKADLPDLCPVPAMLLVAGLTTTPVVQLEKSA